MFRKRGIDAAIGIVVGLVGNVVAAALAHAPIDPPIVAAAYGATFGLGFARRANGAGSGLIWGLAFAWVAWLVIPEGVVARMHGTSGPGFSTLVAYVLGYGMPLGLTFGALGARAAPVRLSIARAIASGGVAGILGGWAFSTWMSSVNFFPKIAAIFASDSRSLGIGIHYAIAIAIGASFGLLFQRDIRGLGSSMSWGVAYGILWWFIGPLTLLPLLTHTTPDWSARNGAALYGSFVGHVVYGLLLGVVYALVDRIWRRLFIDADPLNRESEGPALRTLVTIRFGALGGVVGTAAVAALARATVTDVIATLGFGAALGATYAVLFSYEASDLTASLAWGSTFGAIVWFVVGLTLAPVAAHASFVWTVASANAAFPDLTRSVVLGALAAAVVFACERRHRTWLAIDARSSAREAARYRPSGSSAPAVWIFCLGIAVALPLVLR